MLTSQKSEILNSLVAKAGVEIEKERTNLNPEYMSESLSVGANPASVDDFWDRFAQIYQETMESSAW